MRACRAAKCSLRRVRPPADPGGRARAQSTGPIDLDDTCPPRLAQLRRRAVTTPSSTASCLAGDRLPQRVGERQEPVDGRRHAPTGLSGRAEHPAHERVGVAAVVVLLALRPLDDGGDLVDRRTGQRLPALLLGEVVQPVAGEGVGPVRARQLDEVAAAVLVRLGDRRRGGRRRRRRRAARTAWPRGPARPGRSSRRRGPPRGTGRRRSTRCAAGRSGARRRRTRAGPRRAPAA